MPRRQGGSLSGFTPLSTPNAPTDFTVAAKIGAATVSFEPPADTGDAPITAFIVTTIDESTGESTGVVVANSPATITPDPATTFKVRVQAVNDFGPGRLTEFSTGNELLTGLALYAWGRNNRGQIGDGSGGFPYQHRSSPVQVGALTTWSNVSAGGQSSSAIKTDNTLWTWGFNSAGQLGDDTVVSRSSPVQVGALTNWAQVDVGGEHTSAVKTNGTLWTWGSNSNGQLGLNSGFGTNRSSPVQVGALTSWAQVSAGNELTAAIRTNATLFTWGVNTTGQLGHNNTTARSSPVQVGGSWAKVSAGFTHTLGVRTNGTLWAWGSTTNGKIGDNTNINRSSPVQIGALTTWAQIAAGQNASGAVRQDNRLFTWGGTSLGETGLGDTVSRSSPVQVGDLTNWAKVFAGGQNIGAIKTDETLWVWGGGTYGQLGQNNTANRSSPVLVGSAASAWANASFGGDHIVALLGVS